MGTYVTDTGFVRKTLATIQAEIETSFKSVFGNGIDLDESGPFGQLIGVLSRRESQIWQAAEEIYTSRDPSQATGVSLDNIAAETGVSRITEGVSIVNDVQIFGALATTVPNTFTLKQTGGPVDFVIDATYTIDLSSARSALLIPDTPAGGGGDIYTVTIDGTPYTYTSLPGDVESDVVTALVNLITAGTWSGTASSEDGGDSLRVKYVTTDFILAYTGTLTLDKIAIGATFTAVEPGAYAVPADTLVEIVTPVVGVDSVNNPSAGTTGREVETDSELRIRRDETLFVGNATNESIKNNLLNRVENIQSASVSSNRTDTTDGDGRPPKSFEAVVVGGTDQDIADIIWEVQPAGIASYGNETESVIDSEGRTQTVKFSRPNSVYIHVRVSRDLYDEEEYPADGDNEIRLAIVSWAEENQGIGVDVIRQRLSIPVYSVEGIGDILIEIDATPNPGDPPTYAEDDIDISVREIAEFATSRISVQDLTP